MLLLQRNNLSALCLTLIGSLNYTYVYSLMASVVHNIVEKFLILRLSMHKFACLLLPDIRKVRHAGCHCRPSCTLSGKQIAADQLMISTFL